MANWLNKKFVTIQELQNRYSKILESFKTIGEQSESVIAQQTEFCFAYSDNLAYKLIHPVLIKEYKMSAGRFSKEKPNLIGLDIETNHLTGQPKLLGVYHPIDGYKYLYGDISYRRLYNLLLQYCRNEKSDFVTWGNLDIQCIIRTFAISEQERLNLSRGLSGNITWKGDVIGTPPVVRDIDGAKFFISSYISGRSLKLGIINNNHYFSIWIYNASQFYQKTIANNAKGMKLDWIDYPKETHLIDWKRFEKDNEYKNLCLASNEQDARMVHTLIDKMLDVFYKTFEAYPSILVSTGSLTDAAVSKMLSDSDEDYYSNSWKWLAENIWKIDVSKAETLIAESFSAGYVDQFAIGYCGDVWTADIAGAYPHKIRQLPDLRHSYLVFGEGQLDEDVKAYNPYTAIIRGRVFIPDTLKYHPITIKTALRENYRPTGEFYAAYTLDERDFCLKYGAKFDSEEYVLVCLTKSEVASIAKVSETLREMRDNIIVQLKAAKNEDEKILLDGQQYLVKVIDNSIYGKTVMTVEIVENIDGTPRVIGLSAGDRFNQLYGTLITSKTRVQIANACMEIEKAGGKIIMTMTDSIYWIGNKSDLPANLVNEVKTAGFFESPVQVNEFYLLKTGQYEYSKNGKFTYKLRGIPLVWDTLGDGSQSFYRKIIQNYANHWPNKSAKDVSISLNARKLRTVGHTDIDKLGAVEDFEMELKPFVLSSKQVNRYVENWHDCIDSYIMLETPKLSLSENGSHSDYPLSFFREQYEGQKPKHSKKHYENIQNMRDRKRAYVLMALEKNPNVKIPNKARPLYMWTWDDLETLFGVARNDE